jgi:hypothetical protein
MITSQRGVVGALERRGNKAKFTNAGLANAQLRRRLYETTTNPATATSSGRAANAPEQRNIKNRTGADRRIMG